MKIHYHRQDKRKERTRDQWIRIATDYNGGMTIPEIQKRYVKTDGKPYSRGSIYNILKKLASEGGEK